MEDNRLVRGQRVIILLLVLMLLLNIAAVFVLYRQQEAAIAEISSYLPPDSAAVQAAVEGWLEGIRQGLQSTQSAADDSLAEFWDILSKLPHPQKGA